MELINTIGYISTSILGYIIKDFEGMYIGCFIYTLLNDLKIIN